MSEENSFHHHRHSHAAPNAARITDAFLRLHYFRHHHHHGANQVSTATLVGTTPTTRTDGTALALSDIASINVLDDTGTGPQPIGSIPGPAATFSFTTVGALSVGQHNFSVTVLDIAGHVSAPSNVSTLQVPATLASPSPVADLVATLNPDPPAAAAKAA